MISSFSGPMEMPPCSFESLEAALCQGPYLPSCTPYDASLRRPAAPQTDGLANGNSGGAGDGDVKVEDAEGADADDAAAADAPRPESPLDADAAAAALLLRDVHLALLRCIDATLHKPGAKCPPQPLAASYVVRTGHGIVVSAQHWSQRAAATVHSFAHEVTDSDAALAAAMDLYATDYAHLPLPQRLTVLRALTELALASEALREQVSARMDAPMSTLKLQRPRLMPAESIGGKMRVYGSAKSGKGAPRIEPDDDWAAHEAAARGPRPGDVLAWYDWCVAERIGLGRALGSDLAGRRYWVLGGGAGAWRVYVEGAGGGGGGREWGFYEGPSLAALIRWLAAGAIECEAPMLRSLLSVPWLLKPGAPRTAAAAAGSGGGAGAGAGGAGSGAAEAADAALPPDESMAPPEEMAAARLDGYRGLCGPLVYGELNFDKGAVPAGGAHGRLAQGMTALLSLLPFWMWPAERQGALGALLERAKRAQTGDEIADCLLAVESELAAAGLMDARWAPSGWQAAWRAGLARGRGGARGSLRDLGSHLGALSRSAAVPDNTWPRDSFMHTVETYRCPLVFPAIGSTIMLLRAGAKLHLQKYLKLPDDATDPPSRPELEPLLERVARLPPVKKFLVAAATYRAFPGKEDEEAAAAAAAAAAAEEEQRAAAAAAAAAAKKKEEEGGSDGDGDEDGGDAKQEAADAEAAAAAAAAQAPKVDPNAPPKERPPCLYMLLTPVPDDGAPPPSSRAPRGDVALPIHIDRHLPDLLMAAPTFEERVKKQWAPGERFRMYFGGKHGQKVGGAYYKGTITAISTADNWRGPGEFDPWESVTVHWDNEENSVNKVCPWEVEEDPDEVRRQADLKKKEAAAAAAAAARQAEEEAAAAGYYGSRRAAAAVGSYYEGDGDGSDGGGRGAAALPPLPGAARRRVGDDEFDFAAGGSDLSSEEEDGAMRRRRRREEARDADYDMDMARYEKKYGTGRGSGRGRGRGRGGRGRGRGGWYSSGLTDSEDSDGGGGGGGGSGRGRKRASGRRRPKGGDDDDDGGGPPKKKRQSGRRKKKGADGDGDGGGQQQAQQQQQAQAQAQQQQYQQFLLQQQQQMFQPVAGMPGVPGMPAALAAQQQQLFLQHQQLMAQQYQALPPEAQQQFLAQQQQMFAAQQAAAAAAAAAGGGGGMPMMVMMPGFAPPQQPPAPQ